MGFDRNTTRPYNYANYAKIYLRADLKRTIIQRRYQKLMEFYADASSLLIALYDILFIILNYIDNFQAYHHLSKYLFFFKGIENDNNHNNIKNIKKIKEIISLIEYRRNKLNNNKDEELHKVSFNIPKNYKKKNPNINIQDLNKEKDEKEIIIYDTYKKTQPERKPKNNFSDFKAIEEKGKKSQNKLINSKIVRRQKQSNKIYKHIYKENECDSEVNKMSQINRPNILNFRNVDKSENNLKNSKNINEIKLSSSPSFSGNTKINHERITYKFNIFEILITQFFKCCMTQNMKIKNSVNDNSNEIIFNKLDIISYIRNMVRLDILNTIILDDDEKHIINLLCRPVISVNSNQNNMFDGLNKSFNNQEFDKFSIIIEDLVNKPEMLKEENKLISLSKEHLKSFV